MREKPRERKREKLSEVNTDKQRERERGVKKVPGWSWIEVKNNVHAFNAEDHSHPQCEEIYILLQQLNEGIKLFDNFVDQMLLQSLDNLDVYDDQKFL